MGNDLKAFLEQELATFGEDAKAWGGGEAITEGLGLQSPVKQRPPKKVASPVVPPVVQVESKVEPEVSPKVEVPMKRVNLPPLPPKLPQVGVMSRLGAFTLDQVFVGTVSCMLWVLTSNLMSGFETGFSAEVLRFMMKEEMMKIGLLEYSAVWSFYFLASVFLFGQTLGQWAWGLQVVYDNQNASVGAKFLRWAFSTLFMSTGILTFLLAIRLNGKNVIDKLSASKLVRS